MDEIVFDYENYIQKRLKEIDDLDERRFAKELLLEGLGKLFAFTEKKYEALEERIIRELVMPGERYHTCMTIIEKNNFDPIGNFWFPVCDEDLKGPKNCGYETIYLMADEEGCKEFLKQGTVEGIEKGSGRRIVFQIKRSQRYQQVIGELYQLFSCNHTSWQIIHTGHLERFFDLLPIGMEGNPVCEDIDWIWGKWQPYVKCGMVPLWNIQKTMLHSQEFRVPCVDEVFYEHIFYLPEGQAEEDGYLAKSDEEILAVRYEKNKIILKTRKELLSDVVVYQFHQKETGKSFGYHYPVLANRRKDSFVVCYLHQSGNFLQTPAELCRKMEELSGRYRIEVAGYEIMKQLEAPVNVQLLYGDMNQSVGNQIFSDDKRSILLFKIHRNKTNQEDYLYETQIRYILSQLQMEFPEYRCVSVLV